MHAYDLLPKALQVKPFERGDPRHVQAHRIYLILVAHVMAIAQRSKRPQGPKRRDVLITYSELTERMGMKPNARMTLGVPLGIIAEYCRMNDLPTLNSIVVLQETGAPGEGVLVRDGKTYKEEQREVANEDWFSYRVPAAGTFRRVREYAKKRDMEE